MTKLRPMRGLLAPLSFLVAVACGPGVEEGPILVKKNTVVDDSDEKGDSETDSNSLFVHSSDGDADTATGSDTPLPDGGPDTADTTTLDLTPPECSKPIFTPQNLLRATDHLSDGRFVAMGNGCLLLTAPEDGASRIQVLFIDGSVESYVLGRLEGTFNGTPTDVSCYYDALEQNYFAEVVITDGGHSTIHEGNLKDGDDSWRMLFDESEGVRPLLVGINRIFKKSSSGDYNRICAYGDGIFCTETDGDSDRIDWTRERDPTGDIRYLDMSVAACGGKWCEVAVGTAGRLDVKTDGQWREIQTGVADDLLSVSSYNDERYTAAGKNGVVLHGDITSPDPPSRYQIPLNGDIVSLYWFTDEMFKGVTDIGEVFEGAIIAGALHLCDETVAIEEPVINSIFLSCEDSNSYLVLIDTALVGAIDCDITVIIS